MYDSLDLRVHASSAGDPEAVQTVTLDSPSPDRNRFGQAIVNFEGAPDFSPTRIAERRMGMEMFVTGISSVTANPPNLAQLMTSDLVHRTSEDQTIAAFNRAVASEKLADGVSRLKRALK